jgi:dTDP-4-amino-4,6-dideoxygalactose transaminase
VFILVKKLADLNITARRYFLPSLNNLRYVKYTKMPISENLADRIITLPNYFSLKKSEIGIIIGALNKFALNKFKSHLN